MKKTKAAFAAAAALTITLQAFATPHRSAMQKQARISMAQARQIAMAKERGTVKSEELEKEHGRIIYSFDIETTGGIREVNVDAKSGAVVEDSKETPADEQKEAKADARKK